jgi:hypothetical protein
MINERVGIISMSDVIDIDRSAVVFYGSYFDGLRKIYCINETNVNK